VTCLDLLGIGMTFDDGDACASGKDAAYDGLSPTFPDLLRTNTVLSRQWHDILPPDR
jgi:hypothetical protein